MQPPLTEPNSQLTVFPSEGCTELVVTSASPVTGRLLAVSCVCTQGRPCQLRACARPQTAVPCHG